MKIIPWTSWKIENTSYPSKFTFERGSVPIRVPSLNCVQNPNRESIAIYANTIASSLKCIKSLRFINSL